MALATEYDVEERLGRSLTSAELARLGGLIDESGALAMAYMGWDDEPDPVPAAVTVVVSRMVARALLRDPESDGTVDAVQSTQVAGPFTRTVQFASGTTSTGPWLGAADKAILKRYRVNGGMRSVPLVSDHTGRYRARP